MSTRLLAVALVVAGCSGGGAGAPPDAGVGSGTPDAMGADAAVAAVPPDVDGRIVINELMASNGLTVKDDHGQASDWIELYNPTDQDIPLQGYTLTDDLSHPNKAVLPKDVAVPAGGHLILWMDGMSNLGPAHVGFTLSKKGGDLGLARPDGSFIDRVSYGAQATDFSAAREPDGSNLWVIEWHPSPGDVNPAGAGQPVGLQNPKGAPEAVPAAGDISDKFLGMDVVPQLDIELTQDAIASLRADPNTDVKANLVYQGRTFGPVALHLRGNGAFEPFDGKPEFKIKISAYAPNAKFFELSSLTLNNMTRDPSQLHEELGYWVARQAGLAASRANHVVVTINGQPYGLYSNVETMRKHFIGEWFDDDTGPLYEGFDFTPDKVSWFVLETGTDDRSLITATANAAMIADPDQAIAAASQSLDMDSMIAYWAWCAVVGQFSGWPYHLEDFYTYADPTTHHLNMMPYDLDKVFMDALRDVNGVDQSPLAQKCLASASCKQKWVNKVWDIMDRVDQIDWNLERARIANQIEPYVEADPKRPFTVQDVHDYQQQAYFFMHERRFRLSTMIPPAQ